MTLGQLINQNSFVLVAGLGLGGWLIALLARRARARAWLAWAAAVALAAGAHFASRTPAREFQSVADIQRAISAGRPTLVEFYSNY